MPYGLFALREGDDGAADCGGGRCVGWADSGAADVDVEYDVWLSTPNASEIDGSDCRVVCLTFSCSSPLVRRESGGVCTPVFTFGQLFACCGGGWPKGGGIPDEY